MINRGGLCYIILSPPPTYWRELHKQVLWGSDFSRENFSIQRSTFPRCHSRVIVPHTLKSLNQFIYIFFSFDFEQNFKMFFFVHEHWTSFQAIILCIYLVPANSLKWLFVHKERTSFQCGFNLIMNRFSKKMQKI